MKLPTHFLILLLGTALIAPLSLAATRAAKSIVVSPDDIKKASVNVKIGKKAKLYEISCYRGTPGSTQRKSSKLYFTSYKNQEKVLVKGSAQLIKVKALRKAGGPACRDASGAPSPQPNPPPSPTEPPKPEDHASLEKYDGPFGLAEAQILYNRFGFGATPAQLQLAVNTGMDATVERLLSFIPEPDLAWQLPDISCDGWLYTDPAAGVNNRNCNQNNPNDMSRFGLRTSLAHQFIYSQNPFLQRFAFFLMDERLSVSHLAARDCERHAIKSYIDNVFKAAITGDYKQYMRDMNKDHLLHLRSLDGATNRGGVSANPNENYAREFWELGTVGPTGLNGLPVYSDIDIAQSALALTGWNITDTNINGNNVCVASWVPSFHSGGTKIIFGGTPYQSAITNDEELLEATFRHPRVAEDLAEDIWNEFLNPFAGANEVQSLANIIRSSGYNLLPVFRRVMTSKALYAQRSRNSIIKHPVDMLVGYVKTTGFPLYYRRTDEILSRLEQQLLNPPTVFGWNTKYLSGEQLQVEWWNVLVGYFMNVSIVDLKDDYGWSYYDRFIADLHASGKRTAGDVIDRVASDFGIKLEPAQRAELEQMMNYYLSSWDCPANCNGMPYRMERNLFDTDPSADESGYEWNGQRRIRLLITALLELPQARMK